MPTDTCKITLHMVQSADGMIAKRDNSISWFETLDHYEKGIETSKQEMEQFLSAIDCYIMGARTYEHALKLSASYGWAYGDTPTIVVSHRDLPVYKPNIQIYSGDLTLLNQEQLQPNYKNAWLIGGAKLAKDFIHLKLVDEIRLSVMPIVLGDGLPFFVPAGQELALHLIDVKPYKSGMVELHYEVKK